MSLQRTLQWLLLAATASPADVFEMASSGRHPL